MIALVTLGVLAAHGLGDYVLQNSWMAARKTSDFWIAMFHGWIQGSLLTIALALTTHLDPIALSTIYIATWVTHGYIDRYRLVKPMIWALNQLAPRGFRYSWAEAKANNGHPKSTPAWMSTWLMIVADNCLHLTITFILLAVFL